MKIIVEILDKVTENGEIDWIVNKSKTIEFPDGNKATKISTAKEKLRQLKSTLPDNQKLRVLEYYNDDPDKGRIPCKILFEG